VLLDGSTRTLDAPRIIGDSPAPHHGPCKVRATSRPLTGAPHAGAANPRCQLTQVIWEGRRKASHPRVWPSFSPAPALLEETLSFLGRSCSLWHVVLAGAIPQTTPTVTASIINQCDHRPAHVSAPQLQRRIVGSARNETYRRPGLFFQLLARRSGRPFLSLSGHPLEPLPPRLHPIISLSRAYSYSEGGGLSAALS
jgi:hypothetical protein